MTIEQFLQTCRDAGEEPIPETDPIFVYGKKVGIAVDWLWLCWEMFKAQYRDSGKTQKDWRKHFRNCVRRNWLKLWWIDADGTVNLTSTGRSEAKFHAAA